MFAFLGRILKAIKESIVADAPREEPEALFKDERRPSLPMVKKLTDCVGLRKSLRSAIDEQAVAFSLPWVIVLPAREREDLFRKHAISDKEIDAILLKAYGRHYTASEVMDMIAFFKSAAGQKMLKMSPKMAADVTAAAREKAGSIAISIIKEGMGED